MLKPHGKRIYTVGTQLNTGYMYQLFSFLKKPFSQKKLSANPEQATQIAAEAIIVSDNSDSIVSWNRAAQNLFGYKEKEILGKPLSRLVPKMYLSVLKEQMNDVRSGKAAHLYAIRKSGAEFPAEISVTAWRSDSAAIRSNRNRETIRSDSAAERMMRDEDEKRGKSLQSRFEDDEERKRDKSLSPRLSDDGVTMRSDIARNRATRDGEMMKSGAGIFYSTAIRDITDISKAAESIEYLSSQNELILKSAGEGIVVLDTEEKITFLNPAAQRMLGYKAPELLGRSGRVVWHSLSRTISPPRDSQAHSAESVFWRNDGTSFPAEYLNAPLLKRGKAVGSVVTFKDITDRKRIEEDLLRFKLGLDRTSDAVFITKLDGEIIYVNPSFEKIYGYKKEEALGENPRIIKSGVLPTEAYKQFWGMLLAKKVVSGELVNKAKDGRLLNIEGSANPILDKKGNIIGFLAIQRDITERKKAEGAIEELNRRNELILNSAGEGILGLDTEGRVTFINPAAAKMLGYKPEELVGRVGHMTWHYRKADGAPYPAEECPIYASYRDGIIYRGDDVFWRNDCTSFPVEYVSTPIREQEKLVGAVVAFTDITERKRAEEGMKKLNNELKAKVDALDRFNKLTVGRELKMIELKKQIKRLEEKAGKGL